MKRTKNLLVAFAVLFTALTTSTVVGQTETENFITYDAMNIGNGNFNTTQDDVDAGLTGAVTLFETPDETPGPDPIIQVDRHRVLQGGGSGGPFISGWTVIRRFYMGGNGAIGFDGNYGFATPPYQADNGESGQAFANTGRVEVVSNTYDFNFASGTTVDFEYLVGSDTIKDIDGLPLTAIATPSLVFDAGLPTEFREDFASESGTGSLDPNDNSNLSFNRRSGTYTTTAAYSTVQIRFDLTNELQLGDLNAPQGVLRSLLDQVSLTATGERDSPVLLGDCDQDGVVGFLDIAPFITILSGGTFLAQADCNEDLIVDFLDIQPFIDILAGG